MLTWFCAFMNLCTKIRGTSLCTFLLGVVKLHQRWRLLHFKWIHMWIIETYRNHNFYILVAANYVPLFSPVMYYRFWYSNCCWCMQLSIDHDIPSVLYFLRIFLTLITIIYCFPTVISYNYDYERFLINSFNIVIIMPPTYLSWGPQSLCFWSNYDISHHDIADQAAWWWFA